LPYICVKESGISYLPGPLIEPVTNWISFSIVDDLRVINGNCGSPSCA
jgi:hypothetical protein